MMPPQIDTKPWLLFVSVYKVEKLVEMDEMGNKNPDPFIQVDFAGIHQKPKHQSSTRKVSVKKK